MKCSRYLNTMFVTRLTCECEGGTHIDSGYLCCVSCGAVCKRELDTKCSSFAQNTAPLHNSYTRTKRFVTKIRAALMCRVTCPIDLMLLSSVRCCSTPEDVIQAIAKHVPPVVHGPPPRRPYLHAVAYWVAAGKEMTFPTKREIDHYVRQFEHIFFARARLDITGPNFPYLTLLEFLVNEKNNTRICSDAMRFIMRFVRKLRCQRRRRKYADQYQMCMEYIKNHGDRFQNNESVAGCEGYRHIVQAGLPERARS